MEKRGQHNVLATVLIVFIAIVAVVLVFNIVRPLVSEKSKGIGAGFESYLKLLFGGENESVGGAVGGIAAQGMHNLTVWAFPTSGETSAGRDNNIETYDEKLIHRYETITFEYHHTGVANSTKIRLWLTDGEYPYNGMASFTITVYAEYGGTWHSLGEWGEWWSDEEDYEGNPIGYVEFALGSTETVTGIKIDFYWDNVDDVKAQVHEAQIWGTLPGNIMNITRSINEIIPDVFEVKLDVEVYGDINTFGISEYFPGGWQVTYASDNSVIRQDRIEWLFNENTGLSVRSKQVSYELFRTNSNNTFKGYWYVKSFNGTIGGTQSV